jgi:hypothetical protein
MAGWAGKEVLQVSRGVLLYLSDRVSENMKKRITSPKILHNRFLFLTNNKKKESGPCLNPFLK